MRSTGERELLLLCARTTPAAAERDRIRALVQEGIDWASLLSLAERHWVTPLLAWHLGGVAPGDVAAALDGRLRENVAWSLRLAARLVEVVQALEAARVSAVTWKGPTLATTAYGHPGLRTFADLDVLVRAADLPRAPAALAGQGWQAVPPAPDASEWMFVRSPDRVVVELHWRPTPWSFAVDLDPMDMQHERTRVGQSVVSQLAPADLLVLTSNERRLILGQQVSVTIQNPNFNDPLGGRTIDDFRNIPSNLVLLDTGYETPMNDQISIGLAQQLGASYSVQADYIHTKGRNEPMTKQINYFEDPATHLPLDPTIFGRPFPNYNQITLTSSDGKSQYDGLQMGFNGRGSRLSFGASYTLSKTRDNHANNRGGTPTNPFNLDDEYTYGNADQRHRFIGNVLTTLPYDIQFAAIYFVGSPQTINVSTTRDPFRLGYNGRWLENPADCPCTGRTVPRNSERTNSDYKLDLRLSKTVRFRHVSVQGIAEVFNVLNTRNLTNQVTNVFSQTYLRPATSTNLFYQPRQVQVGFRISY